MDKRIFLDQEAKEIGDQINIDWSRVNIKEFKAGLAVELEHGSHDATTNVTDNDMVKTGKIALAHLNEYPDYYTRLEKLEDEAEEYWSQH